MRKITLGALALTLCLPLAAGADEAAPENYIKYRQQYMTALGGHVGASAQIVRGRVAPEGHLARHAAAIAELTRDLTVLFPEDSDFGETEAKENIWSEWKAFQQAARRAARAGEAFQAAVQGGDKAAIGRAFADLGKACKGCHKKFRKKKAEDAD